MAVSEHASTDTLVTLVEDHLAGAITALDPSI